MTWPTVQIGDVTSRIPKTLTTAEQTVATTRIADAADIIQYHLRIRGVLDAPTDEPWATQFATRYKRIVADMVARHISNYEGWVEQTVAIDDYRETFRRAGDTLPQHLYVEDVELDSLLPPSRQGRRRGAFSIRLGNV